MLRNKLWIAALAVSLVLASPAWADHKDKHKPKGGGGGDEDGSGGQPITPAVLTFRDCNDGFSSSTDFLNLHAGGDPCATNADLVDDRVQSDTNQSYIHNDQLVGAFLGSQANTGNVWLKLANSPRGLVLDFTDCASPAAECNPPFATAEVSDSAIKVDANDVKKDGLFGMAVGESISAPMRIWYQLPGDDRPGFVDFDPKLTGGSPCKNKSNRVTVIRTATDTWEVIGDPNIIACVTLPDDSFGGTYTLPFQFTVQPK